MACIDMNREIREHTVYVRQWPAEKAVEMQSKLVASLGETVFPFIMEDTIHLHDLMQVWGKEDFKDMLFQVIDGCAIDGERVTRMSVSKFFDGDLWFLYEVFAFVLEIQFRTFFQEGLDKLKSQEQSLSK